MKNNSLKRGKMLKRRIYDVLTIVALLLFISGVTQADILRVPAQYPTIQEGLNAALANDTVLVSVGTYYENIIWPSIDSIHLMSEAGASQTIIDGNNTDRVISITTGVSLNTEIRGFTIRHGYTPYGESGAGILCENSSPTIEENIITYNNGFKGSGIYCHYSNPLILDNQIANNEGYYGVGIGLRFSDPVIKGNVILYNNSTYGWAAGIDCYDASPVIIGNTISYNSCQYNGAGIYCTRSHSIIQFNDILYNIAVWQFAWTGGIYCYRSPDLRINFNNIVGNDYGVWNHQSGDSLNAKYNWWGYPSGPGGAGPGIGDSVTVNVDYTPWLQELAPPLPVVSTDTTYGAPGDTINIPIMVSELTGLGVVSAEFTLSFDSTIITGVDVDASGTLLSDTDWTWQYNVVGDTFSVAMEGTDTLAGSGTLINLIFTVSLDAQSGEESPLHFVEFMFNEGTLSVTTQDGVFIVTSVGVEDETPQVPSVFALRQNYPNPFNPETTIKYRLKEKSQVKLEIFNIKGQKVRILIDSEQDTGYHQVLWNGKDNSEKSVSSGIYLYRITAGDFTDTKKCVILK